MKCVYYFPTEEAPTAPLFSQKKKQKKHQLVKRAFFIEHALSHQQRLTNKYPDHFYLCETVAQLTPTDNLLLTFDNSRPLLPLKEYLRSSCAAKDSDLYFATLCRFYRHLLVSLDLFVQHNLSYNYLQANSILVDTERDLPLLSNFTFSLDCSLEHLRRYVVAYDPSYREWPLELHLLSYLLVQQLPSLSLYNIETVIHDVNVLEEEKEAALHHFAQFVNLPYAQLVQQMLLPIVHTWDNFALSLLFLQLLPHNNNHNHNKFISSFMKLLLENYNINPTKRHSPSQTLLLFDQLFF